MGESQSIILISKLDCGVIVLSISLPLFVFQYAFPYALCLVFQHSKDNYALVPANWPAEKGLELAINKWILTSRPVPLTHLQIFDLGINHFISQSFIIKFAEKKEQKTFITIYRSLKHSIQLLIRLITISLSLSIIRFAVTTPSLLLH